MNAKKLLTLLAAVAAGALAWRAGGAKGLLLLFSGLVMWGLLYINRVLTVMRRANQQPVGYVGSAVMLNAKLKPGLPLLHVMALTHSMGERLSSPGADPEIYRWQDPGHSSVTAHFAQGRLQHWQLTRPSPTDTPDGDAASPAASASENAPDQTPDGGDGGNSAARAIDHTAAPMPGPPPAPDTRP